MILTLQLTRPIDDALYEFHGDPDKYYHSLAGYRDYGHAKMSASGRNGEIPIWSWSGSSSGRVVVSSSSRKGDPRGMFPYPIIFG